jgi:2-amino-4-hydroxy-6-hydroxymethyldihydropteridine diphosphokinase
MKAVCYLGIGSNLGDRRKYVKSAVKLIAQLKGTEIIKISRFINTEPIGCPPGAPEFLNGAIKIKTSLGPVSLLSELKKIERALGRTAGPRNSARTIDIDILLYADKILRTKKLIIPHPRMFERDFVLKPLSEII